MATLEHLRHVRMDTTKLTTLGSRHTRLLVYDEKSWSVALCNIKLYDT